MTAKIACPCAVNWFHSYLKQTDRQTDKRQCSSPTEWDGA